MPSYNFEFNRNLQYYCSVYINLHVPTSTLSHYHLINAKEQTLITFQCVCSQLS